MNKKFLLSIILLGTLVSGCAGNQKKSGEAGTPDAKDLASLELKLPVERIVLPNGLRVLLMSNPSLPIYSYYTFYDVGGRYEGPGTTGATHFLEHMMFKGSQNYGPGFFDQFVDSNGGSNNAYTSFDSTVYYQNMPKETLEEMIKIEADRMNSILLIPLAFESERKVILEERKMRYENSPRGQMFQALTQEVFAGTPYGGSVIGSEEDILGLNRERMLEFHKTFYSPNNAVIVIIGDIDLGKTSQWIRRAFTPLSKNEKLAELKTDYNREEVYRPKAKMNPEMRLHGESPRPIFALAYRGEKLGARRAYVMDILASILGSGESSYFHQNYVSGAKPQLSSVGVANYNLKYNGVFFVTGELLEKTSLPKFKQTLMKDVSEVCIKAIDERSLQKTKNQYLVSYYNELQTNAGVASFLGQRESFFGDYMTYKDELKTYNSITLAEVQVVCREVFGSDDNFFLSVWEKHPKKS